MKVTIVPIVIGALGTITKVYACHFLGQVLGYAYTICLYGRIEISCTFPSGSPCLPSRVSLYTPSVLIWCIRLLCDWSFRLCHRIAYIYCFVASYLFSLWYDWFLWRYPVIIIIIFLPPCFFFLNIWSLSECRCPQVLRTLRSIVADINNAIV